MLLDFVDFVVHVFHPTLRNFYQLERLWADAEQIPVDGATAARVREDRRGASAMASRCLALLVGRGALPAAAQNYFGQNQVQYDRFQLADQGDGALPDLLLP